MAYLATIWTTDILSHLSEPTEHLVVRPVELEPLSGILSQRAQNDQRADLPVDIAVLELLPDRPRAFLPFISPSLGTVRV